jgi:hypothetical protein
LLRTTIIDAVIERDKKRENSAALLRRIAD